MPMMSTFLFSLFSLYFFYLSAFFGILCLLFHFSLVSIHILFSRHIRRVCVCVRLTKYIFLTVLFACRVFFFCFRFIFFPFRILLMFSLSRKLLKNVRKHIRLYRRRSMYPYVCASACHSLRVGRNKQIDTYMQIMHMNASEENEKKIEIAFHLN